MLEGNKNKTVNTAVMEDIQKMPEYTTIKISTRNRDRLQELGSMKDSYDTVLDKLIKFYEQHGDLHSKK